MSKNIEVTAVILAGGDPDDRLTQQANVSSKALVAVAGKPQAFYVLDALQSCQAVKHIVYVGETHPDLGTKFDEQLDAGQRFIDTLSTGLKAGLNQPQPWFLIITADLPWLTATDVEAFLYAPSDASVRYPVISKEAVEQAFPEQTRDYVQVTEGLITGGSMALVHKDVVTQVLQYAEQAYQSRKNILALARLVGFGILFKFLIKRVSLKDIEKRISRILKTSVEVVWLEHPNLAIDVDEPEHLENAERDLRVKE